MLVVTNKLLAVSTRIWWFLLKVALWQEFLAPLWQLREIVIKKACSKFLAIALCSSEPASEPQQITGCFIASMLDVQNSGTRTQPPAATAILRVYDLSPQSKPSEIRCYILIQNQHRLMEMLPSAGHVHYDPLTNSHLKSSPVDA